MIVGVTVLALAVLIGLIIGHHEVQEHKQAERNARFGWIYFLGGEEGPIKVGMSQYEPTEQRLPELRTMSPVPLQIFYKAPVDDRFRVERALHSELAPYRQHGEWFDRDVALAWADHLKGAM